MQRTQNVDVDFAETTKEVRSELIDGLLVEPSVTDSHSSRASFLCGFVAFNSLQEVVIIYRT